MESQNRRQKVIVENVLQGGRLSLDTVQQVAAFTGVPYLSSAAGLVLKIFDIIQVWPVHYHGIVLIFKSLRF